MDVLSNGGGVLRSIVKKLWRPGSSRSGNFAVLSAILLPVVLLAGGVAIDIANLIAAKEALQSALDHAVLAGSHLSESIDTRKAAFDRVLKANVANGDTLRNVAGSLNFETGANYLEAKGVATADVNLVFLDKFDFRDVHLKLDAVSYQSTRSLEVAMVIDNTGSLGASGIAAVRDAAGNLVDLLKTQSESNKKSIKAALVPFVTAVNVKGNDYDPSWIDMKGKAAYNGVHFKGNHDHLWLFDKLGVAWKGCVEARPSPLNFTDAAPDAGNPDTLFVPYFAPDNPGPATDPGNDGNRFNNSYLDDQIEFGKPVGDASDQLKRQQNIAKYTSNDSKNLQKIDEVGPLTNGPNRACPTPIVPLTSDFDSLHSAVDDMIYWNGSGTNVSEGLSWGWRVLSPGEPYTEGAPFDDPAVSKAVVLFTDGENVVFGARNEAINRSDYGAYGYLDDGRFGTTDQTAAARQVDEWTKTVCTSLKERGVDIYAVLLNADSPSNRALYTACVSAPENYYAISSSSQLKDVFSKIGSQLTQLYLRD